MSTQDANSEKLVSKSKIRRLAITHPDMEWCIECAGEGIIPFIMTKCLRCDGTGAIKKNL